MRFITLSLVATLLGMSDLQQAPIVVRHDVADSLYLEMGRQFSSVVRVGERGGDGTLIAKEWVLTAAHVAQGMAHSTKGNFRVYPEGVEEGVEAAQVILHPDFEPMGPHDMALIRLATPVEGVTAVPLYRNRLEAGKPVVIVGHGDTRSGRGGEWIVDGRRRGATNIIDRVTDHHIVFDFDKPGEATALEGTAGRGDSGGPAFIKVDGVWQVAGVSSLGEDGGNGPGTYGAREYYVRVSSHQHWIDKMMSSPPTARRVNFSAGGSGGARRMRTGRPPEGVVVLEEIGLLVGEREGDVRMVGRIDERFPDVLLSAGIRPPAVISRLNGRKVESTSDLERGYAEIPPGGVIDIEFVRNGETQRFELTK